MVAPTVYLRSTSRSQKNTSQNQRSFSVRFRQYQILSPSDIRKFSYLGITPSIHAELGVSCIHAGWGVSCMHAGWNVPCMHREQGVSPQA